MPLLKHTLLTLRKRPFSVAKPGLPFFWVAVISFAFLIVSCTNDLKDVMALPGNSLSPSQVGDSVTMLYADSAQLKVMVKANRMLVFNKNVKEPLTILPSGVFVTFFNEDEKVSATLRANYGIRYDLSRRMEAKYQVQVINKNGEKLETERLVWDERTKKIHTDAYVKITRGNNIIEGQGMVSNQDFTQYEIKKAIGQFQVKND